MVVPRLIERKRDGGALSPEEWHALIEAYVAGLVPDYQMSALAMAVLAGLLLRVAWSSHSDAARASRNAPRAAA